MKKANNKISLFLGLLFIVSAFMCTAAVFYQVIQEQQHRAREVEDIKKNFSAIEEQKMAAQQMAQDLSKRVGRGIEFDRLLSAAEQKYGVAERSRKTGDLWIDREGNEWMVTLGALNGVKTGSRLRVSSGQDQIGIVVAKTVLDVVSYVDPLGDVGQFQEDIYQVVLE